MKRFVILLFASLFVSSGFLTPSQAVETPQCNDLGYERTYGSSGGCLMSVSDNATTISGRSINPSFITCPGGRDSVLYIYLPNVPKTGQLDGLDKVQFEFTYFNDCSTWPDALSFDLYLTDKEGRTYPIEQVKNSQVYRSCSIYVSCFPGAYVVNEVSGAFEGRNFTSEGYYKFSLKVTRDLSSATPYERQLAGQEQTMLMEFSNQLWFKKPIQVSKPTPTPTPTFCSESARDSVVYVPNTKSGMTKQQVSALSKFLKTKPKNCTNGETIWFVECIGSYSSKKDKQLAESRAKNVCLAAKKVAPKAEIFSSAKPKQSINLWVDVKAYYRGE